MRIENRESLTEKLSAVLKTMPKDEILARMAAAKVPGGPINTVAEALASDQAEARGGVIEMPREDVEGQSLNLLGNPLKMSATPVTYRRPPPRFGEHTGAVLETLSTKKPLKP